MTQTLPPMATFGELLRTAVSAASYRVVQGSRHNAAAEIAARRDDAVAGAQILASLRGDLSSSPDPLHRRSA